MESTDSDKRISFVIERSIDEEKSPTATKNIEPEIPLATDPAKYQRNMSFFNFNVRSASDTTVMRQKAMARKKKPIISGKSLDTLPEEDRKKLVRLNPVETPHVILNKSNSLSDISK